MEPGDADGRAGGCRLQAASQMGLPASVERLASFSKREYVRDMRGVSEGVGLDAVVTQSSECLSRTREHHNPHRHAKPHETSR